MPETSSAVLITGCSSGIGRATAKRLAKTGLPIYATARKLDAIADLEADGCRLLELDVLDEDSMKLAVQTIESEHGAVGTLINNAGYSQGGAVESVPLDKVERQFETNVFGPIRLTQLVLPGMRKQRSGKIINISSMGTKFTFPGGGYYHATKAALESISDALRFEVRGFGIDVVLVEPGLIMTEFGTAAVGSLSDAEEPDPAYGSFNAAVGAATEQAYTNGPLSKFGGKPDRVAKRIEKIIASSRPKARYLVTPSAYMIAGMRRLMSDRVWDASMRRQFPSPGKT